MNKRQNTYLPRLTKNMRKWYNENGAPPLLFRIFKQTKNKVNKRDNVAGWRWRWMRKSTCCLSNCHNLSQFIIGGPDCS